MSMGMWSFTKLPTEIKASLTFLWCNPMTVMNVSEHVGVVMYMFVFTSTQQLPWLLPASLSKQEEPYITHCTQREINMQLVS